MTRGRAFTLTSGYYAVLFFALGAHLPYWPVWMADWGLDDGDIGRMLGLAILARVIGATVFPALADRFAVRRIILAGSACLSACIILLHLDARTEVMLLVLTLAMALSSAPMIPIGEALGLRASERFGFAYAHTRAAGSVAFLAMVLGMGPIIDHFGSGAILVVLVGSLLAASVFGAFHPGGGAAPGTRDRSRWSDVRRLTGKQSFLLFAIAAAFGQAAHAIYYTYSALQWSDAGISKTAIGGLWAIGVAAEILLFFGPGRRWVAAMGPAQTFVLAAVAGVIRWAVMTVEPTGLGLWLLQAMHALTFGLTLLASMAFIAAAVPPRLAASAQGVSAGLFGGIMMAGLTLLSGEFTNPENPASLYWIGVAAAAVSGLAALGLRQRWDGGRLFA
ncbi:MAG: MFS transporter [Pseudomonadota bacterium]